MEQLSGATIRRLMRQNHQTISGVAARFNLSQSRVRYVRANGVKGAAFVRDWLQIATGA